MTEKVLEYDCNIVPQETGFWCGPASTQVVLNSRGVIVSEAELARQIGTTVNGTDFVGLIERALDQRMPDAKYTSVDMPTDPPTADQREKLWRNVKSSIDAGYGVVMNWVAPPANYPRGVKGSQSPGYGGGRTVFHYVACMGYDDAGERALWIADSGFRPNGYWIGFDQVATLIPPKAYAYAAVTSQEPEVNPFQSPVEVLAEAMGRGVPLERYHALLPAVVAALRECDCTTVDRIAMWMAQLGHESGSLKFMEEIADGSQYENRSDLGNTQVGDGRRFKGRGPIQLTGRNNYAAASLWAHSRGLVPSPTFFVDQPTQLCGDTYGFVGVVWYWTVARNINAFADAGDLEGATRAINGGLHGIEDRRQRWSRCRQIGTRLLTIIDVPEADRVAGAVPVPATKELMNDKAGVGADGWPLPWRFVYSRSARAFNQIVADPVRGRWVRKQPDGTLHDGHTDAYEQVVTTAEQIAWTHEFSDGIVRDCGDVLLELMEFAIQWRSANGRPTSAFAETPAAQNPPRTPRKVPAKKVPAKKTPARKAPATAASNGH